MSWRMMKARLRGTRAQESLEQQMNEEMRFHVDMAIERNLRAGLSPAEARRRALVQFGAAESYREEGREAQRARFLENVISDVRFALRSLRKSPSFTIAAIATIALGIGANASVFSVVNGILFRPLPIPAPEEIVYVGWNWARGGQIPALTSFQFDYVRRNAQTLGAVVTYRTREYDLGEAGSAEPVRGLSVTNGFFDAIGFHPALGRAFDDREIAAGGPEVV